nr:hypothetical protein [Tanacetum cinerariifolium]
LGGGVYDSWKLQGDVEELWDELAMLGLCLRCCLVSMVSRLKEGTKGRCSLICGHEMELRLGLSEYLNCLMTYLSQELTHLKVGRIDYNLLNLWNFVQSRVLAQETTKNNQALEIRSLKIKVKKLLKKVSKRTHKLSRLYKIGSLRRIKSLDEASLGDQEDASKQGRIINNLDADEGVTLVDETQERNNQDMFDTGVLDDDEFVAEKEVSTVDPVTTTGEVVNNAGVEVSDAGTTLTISIDDITLAKALAALKSAKPMIKELSVPKAKGIVMQEPKETTIRTTTTTMLQNIDREDLETLWKLVKAKYGNTRLEEAYERVLWGDMKVMFEPDIESEVWRKLQGNNIKFWKLFSSCGVHFMRFQNLHIFMLVEKRYPLTPATITEMLNRKLQGDHWNEMCYQLLKLMLKQQKKRNEVFGYNLLVKIKLLIKKLEDSEGEHQVWGRIIGIQRLHDDLRVIAAQVHISAVKLNLMLFSNPNENYAKWLALVV